MRKRFTGDEVAAVVRLSTQENHTLLQIAKHPKSRDCLVVFGSIVENRDLIERLIDKSDAVHPQPRRKRRT